MIDMKLVYKEWFKREIVPIIAGVFVAGGLLLIAWGLHTYVASSTQPPASEPDYEAVHPRYDEAQELYR